MINSVLLHEKHRPNTNKAQTFATLSVASIQQISGG